VIGSAADAITFLERTGVDFDRDGAGRSLHLEAGHRRARVAHVAGDRSGEAITVALWSAVGRAAHVDVRCGWRALDLLSGVGVAGALVVDPRGRLRRIHARETVLATGGIGRLFRHTTNGPYATGDGLAMALAAGARTAALEFVQFHPTALRVAADPLPLLTEAAPVLGWSPPPAAPSWKVGILSVTSRRATSSRARFSRAGRAARKYCWMRERCSRRPRARSSREQERPRSITAWIRGGSPCR
jgi:hypothetical protein